MAVIPPQSEYGETVLGTMDIRVAVVTGCCHDTVNYPSVPILIHKKGLAANWTWFPRICSLWNIVANFRVLSHSLLITRTYIPHNPVAETGTRHT